MSSQLKPSPSTEREKQGAKLAKASAGGASILIALQVGSRALTFFVNQILLRYLSPELLGLSTHLEVYSISVLFFARESLRVAIQRQSDGPPSKSKSREQLNDEKKKPVNAGHVIAESSAGKSQTIVNLSYISMVLGLISTITLSWAYLRVQNPVLQSVPYFTTSLKIYGLAALVELLSEPVFVVVQQKLKFKIRARAESTATLLRCLATTGTAVWAARSGLNLGVLPFAVGQAIYSAALTAVYFASASELAIGQGQFFFLPTPILSSDKSYLAAYFSRPILTLGTSLFAQTIVKHVLTQGDTLLIAALASTTVQGSYALATNYGGLLARLLLQPIEETSRSYFGKLLNDKESRPSKDVVESARDTLSAILRSYVLVSFVAVTCGPYLAPILLRYVAGSRWEASGAGEVLGTYCYFIPLLAVNGLTEAFVSAVATKSEINKQSSWMLLFSAAFAASALYFVAIRDMGAKGLVWANVVNMSLRIVWSSNFIGNYWKRNGTSFDTTTIRPQPMVISASIGAAIVFNLLTKQKFNGSINDLYMASAATALLTITIAISEYEFLWDRYRAFHGLPPRPKKDPNEDDF